MFKEAENQQAFLKMGIMGFAGSGKTYTAGLIAQGIFKQMKNGKKQKPVYFLDTETGSDFLVPRFKELKIPFFSSKSIAFEDLLKAIDVAEKEASILIVDSVSHYWKELMESYMKQKGRDRLYFQDWGPLKNRWNKFTTKFINSKVHVIICGRAGYEYDYHEDEDGKKQLEKVGTKMKTEGEFGYEPSLLVEMVKERKPSEDPKARGVEGQLWYHTAYVLKDRTTLLEGKIFRDPDFSDFAPAFNFLNLGGDHVGVDLSHNSQGLFKDGDKRNWEWTQKQKRIVIEEAKGLLDANYPGQAKEEKQARSDLTLKVFGTYSATKIETLPLEKLQDGLEELQKLITKEKKMPKANLDKVQEAGDYSPVPKGWYDCAVSAAREGVTPNKGTEYIELTWEIMNGDYQGKTVRDTLYFTDGTMPRIKLLCKRAGVDFKGDMNFTPEMFMNRNAKVEVAMEEYTSKSGDLREKNVVTFAGYDKYDGGPDGKDDIPF